MAKKQQEAFPTLEVHDDESVLTNLDPRLQKVIVNRKRGGDVDQSLVSVSPDGRQLVDVLARLEDVDAEVPGLNKVEVAGPIVTGTVAVEDIETVRTHPNVVSLKAALPVKPTLAFSVHDIQSTPADISAALPAGSPAIDGRGVIIGIIDFGCDFVHNNFRKADGTSRVLALWDQRGGSSSSASPSPYNYGREITKTQLDAALATPSPYIAVTYDPGVDAHGTHVMDIATGNGRATGAPGVAPGADVIFVHLAANDFTMDQAFGNSRRLAEAAGYIFRKAAALGRPAVINMSLGTNGGPHDGSTHAEVFFDSMLALPGRAIAIAAGNSRMHNSHATGTIAAGATRSLGWQVPSGDPTSNEMEIWYANSGTLAVTLVTPSGQRIGPVAPGDPVKVLSAGGTTAGQIIHRANDPNNQSHQADIILEPVLPSGTWTVELRNSGTTPVEFHAWIERDDNGRSRFTSADSLSSHTLGSISCGAQTIVVASYNHSVTARDLSDFSSEGPTRRGVRKPEITAPGNLVLAAKSRTQGTVAMGGTSMATPHVTGVIALMLQAGGASLTNAAIRDALIRTARTLGTATGWNGRSGNGGVLAAAAVRQVLPAQPPATAVEPQVVGADYLPASGRQVGSLVDALIARTRDSRIRIRFELEIEPVNTQTTAQT
ncbi:MAG TPA: S8 family peptidase [Thermoanaerobaculia bacterium]|nr:S8 family peptidase [Thermoanaerobaculia bacterium]